MNIEDFVKTVKLESAFLSKDGFSEPEISESGGYVSFLKESMDRDFCIEFHWTPYGEQFDVYRARGYIRFHSVEKEIYKVKGGKYNRRYTIVTAADSSKGIREGLPYKHFPESGAFNYEIETVEQLKIFMQVVKDFYIQTAIPFFEEYKTLDDINAWLNKTDFMEHSKLIVSGLNEMMDRKLLIMKLGNNSGFEELYKGYKNFIEQRNEAKESPYPDMYKVFKKLEDVFEATE